MVLRVGVRISAAQQKHKDMKKLFDFLLIEFIVIVHLCIDACFAYLGWNILTEFLTVGFIIPYPGWLMILLFMNLIIFGNSQSKTYEADEIFGAEFTMLQFTRIFNKTMTLLLMSIIYWIF